MELGLEAGSYSILNERDDKIFEAKIVLNENKTNRISRNDFQTVNMKTTVSKGMVDINSEELLAF